MQLIDKWRNALYAASIIPSWTEPETLAFLAELASQSTRILEVGCYLGRSAKVMLLSNPLLTLYCIDTFTCQAEPKMIEYLDAIGCQDTDLTTFDICSRYSLAQEISEGRCVLFRGTSSQFVEAVPEFQFDAAWIDGGHDSETVKSDIENLLPWIKPGGIMCGHDFDVPYNDVARGVINSRIHYDVPIPRMWRHVKP